MNERQLEFLRLVIKTGGFGRAAQLAGVSQPAVSQAMAALADEVGRPLFLRQGRRRVPTAHAVAMADAGVLVENAWSEVRRAGRRSGPSSPPGVLRVGLAPAAGLLYGPLMVRVLQACERAPLLAVSTEPADRMLRALQAGQLDLVIAPKPRRFRTAGLQQHLMYLSRPVIHARRGHPLAGARRLEEIAQARWAVAGSAGTPSNVVEEAFRVRGWAPPRIAVQCADYAMLLRIIGSTDLLGVVTHPALLPERGGGAVVAVDVVDGLPHYEVGLFWHPREKGRAAPAGLDRVVDALREAAGELA